MRKKSQEYEVFSLEQREKMRQLLKSVHDQDKIVLVNMRLSPEKRIADVEKQLRGNK